MCSCSVFVVIADIGSILPDPQYVVPGDLFPRELYMYTRAMQGVSINMEEGSRVWG